MRTVTDLINDIQQLTQEIQELYCQDDSPMLVGFSGGKDSTCTLQLIWYAIAALPPEKRTKTIHVMATDTMVENPIVSLWVKKSIAQMQKSATEQGMPVEAHHLFPEIRDTFWVNLIGKGYPAPRPNFRWCTDRLKIKPATQFIRNMVRASGNSIVALGIRKAESIQRATMMERYKSARERLSPNGNLPNSLVYSPIEDWTTQDVWVFLNQWTNPWGCSNKELFALYRSATDDNDCPVVVDTTTPSCGGSRLGCWTCTLVSRDKSMTAMIRNDEEKEWMQPLLDIRDELDIEDDSDKRDFRRNYGKVEVMQRQNGEETQFSVIRGPYTKPWREHWLRRVLLAQVEIRSTGPAEVRNIELISPAELSEIRRIWLEEKHELDDALPCIYQEVMGEPFNDSRNSYFLDEQEWLTLIEVCNDDPTLQRMMESLLSTEKQLLSKSRRHSIYKALEQCLIIYSQAEEEAIASAIAQQEVKNSLQ
jgi:DNA sulfur modification protein DndC